MEITIKGSPRELEEKSGEVVDKLSEFFQSFAPDVADQLRKAVAKEPVELRHPVLKALHKQTSEKYNQHVAKMLVEIGAVLDKAEKQTRKD
jgi:hypothetical protein